MAKYIIDTDKINHLTLQGKNLVIEPKSETAILQLLYMRKYIDEAIKNIKAGLVEQANKIMPNFRGFIGEHIKCIYRSYGSKYKAAENYNLSNSPFVKQKISYVIDTEAVDRYVEENGKLPDGIEYSDREKQLSFNETEIEELFSNDNFLRSLGIQMPLQIEETQND